MTDQTVDEGVDPNEEEFERMVKDGIAAMNRIHALEREMLSRAVHSLSDMTKKKPEEILSILSRGLDAEYEAAVKQSATSAMGARLYLPTPA